MGISRLIKIVLVVLVMLAFFFLVNYISDSYEGSFTGSAIRNNFEEPIQEENNENFVEVNNEKTKGG